MSAFLIHVGVDDCYRVPVLKGAGFFVEECRSVRGLGSTLIDFPEPDAIAIAESDEIEAGRAMALVRSSSTAPLILFQGRNRCLDASGFNLVIPPLTEPHAWLSDLVSLIEDSRQIRSRSRSIGAYSVLLRREAQVAVNKSRQERRRSAILCNRLPHS